MIYSDHDITVTDISADIITKEIMNMKTDMKVTKGLIVARINMIRRAQGTK